MLEKENKVLFNSLIYGYRKKALEERTNYFRLDRLIKDICIHMQYFRDDEKNYIYFSKLYSKLKYDNETGISAKDMFKILLSNANFIKQNIDEGLFTLEDTKEENMKLKEKDNLLLKKAILNRIEIANYWDREYLLNLEKNQFENSKGFFNYFHSNVKARGEIMGEFNKGFYGMTLQKLTKEIRETVGPVNNKNRFVQYMPDDLLRFRVSLMDIVRIYDEKMRKDSFIANDEYIKSKLGNLGNCARELYYNMNEKNPEEEIITNVKLSNKNKKRNKYDDAQISMFDDTNPKTRTRDKH